MTLMEQMFDNLFSANHRNAMIRQHGGTQAQIIKVWFDKEKDQAVMQEA